MSILSNFAQLVAEAIAPILLAKITAQEGVLVQSLKTELSSDYQQLLAQLEQVPQELATQIEAIPQTIMNDLRNIIPFPFKLPEGE